MAYPFVDNTLFNTCGSTVAAERMPKKMPTVEDFPFAADECLFEKVAGLVAGDRGGVGQARFDIGESKISARMSFQPSFQNPSEI